MFGQQTMFDGVWSANISCFGQAFTYSVRLKQYLRLLNDNYCSI